MTAALIMTVPMLYECLSIPVSAQPAVKLATVGQIAVPADLVEVSNNYLYAAAGTTLRIIDVADPSAPKVAGVFQFSERVWDFTVSRSIVYAAVDWLGLGILDTSNPAAPKLRGSFKTVGQAWSVAVSGAKALVANQMSGVDLVDVSNPDGPSSLGTYFTEGYARGVAAAGPLAYVVDQPTGFSVLDLTKEGPPEEVSTQQSAQSPLIVEVSRLANSSGKEAVIACVLSGRLLDITGGGRGGGLQIYDVSDPSAPRKVTTFATPGQAMGVALDGSVAFVADGAAGLQIVDLADPARPAILGSHDTAGPARDVAVAGPLVFVVVGESSKGAGPGTGGAGVLILRREF